MSCGYCNNKNHNISNCPVDNELVKLLYSKEDVDFSSLSYRTLRKIASRTPYKTCLAKHELIEIFNNIKKSYNNSQETCHYTNECSICYEKLGKTNICTTPCGHMFCMTCILQLSKNNSSSSNKCPLCRKPLIENNVENNVENNNSNDIQSNIQMFSDMFQPMLYDDINIIPNEINSPIPRMELFDNIDNIYEETETSTFINDRIVNNETNNNVLDNIIDDLNNNGIFQNYYRNQINSLSMLERSVIDILQNNLNIPINENTTNRQEPISRRNNQEEEFAARQEYIDSINNSSNENVDDNNEL